MLYLLLVSLLWAFSFGLIKTNLTSIHPVVVTIVRLFFAALVFLPFFRPNRLDKKAAGQLFVLGALEFGLMYIFYNLSFQYLKAFEVALFTIFTPFYVALANSWFQRKWNTLYLLTAILAILGTVIIKYTDISRSGLILGFFIVQLSNICFAIGQVLYKRVMINHPQVKDLEIFALPYLGSLFIAVVAGIVLVDWPAVHITLNQWWNLLYLGILASGFGFFLWNYGARRTNIGALAIFNNLKIPLSITVSMIFFGEETNLLTLVIGGIIILTALVLNELFDKRRQLSMSQQ